jgi:hypothetical protein
MEINASNFDQYFFDVRTHKPEKNQVMASYTAIAELREGRLKSDLIDLFLNKDKTEAAIQLLRKIGLAKERDAIKVCREICEDLKTMSVEEVEKKSYKFVMEAFYYTQKEHIPLDDPHWNVISLVNLNEFLDAANQRLKITSKLVE